MQGRLHLLFKIGVQVIYINACTTFHQFSLHMQHNGPDSVYLYEKSALLMRMVRRERVTYSDSILRFGKDLAERLRPE